MEDWKGLIAVLTLAFFWIGAVHLSARRITRRLWLASERRISLEELRHHSFSWFGLRGEEARPWKRQDDLHTADNDLIHACRRKLIWMRLGWGVSGFVSYWLVLKLL